MSDLFAVVQTTPAQLQYMAVQRGLVPSFLVDKYTKQTKQKQGTKRAAEEPLYKTNTKKKNEKKQTNDNTQAKLDIFITKKQKTASTISGSANRGATITSNLSNRTETIHPSTIGKYFLPFPPPWISIPPSNTVLWQALQRGDYYRVWGLLYFPCHDFEYWKTYCLPLVIKNAIEQHQTSWITPDLETICTESEWLKHVIYDWNTKQWYLPSHDKAILPPVQLKSPPEVRKKQEEWKQEQARAYRQYDPNQSLLLPSESFFGHDSQRNDIIQRLTTSFTFFPATIVSGPHGSGKTCLIMHCCNQVKVDIVSYTSASISEDEIRSLLQQWSCSNSHSSSTSLSSTIHAIQKAVLFANIDDWPTDKSKLLFSFFTKQQSSSSSGPKLIGRFPLFMTVKEANPYTYNWLPYVNHYCTRFLDTADLRSCLNNFIVNRYHVQPIELCMRLRIQELLNQLDDETLDSISTSKTEWEVEREKREGGKEGKEGKDGKEGKEGKWLEPWKQWVSFLLEQSSQKISSPKSPKTRSILLEIQSILTSQGTQGKQIQQQLLDHFYAQWYTDCEMGRVGMAFRQLAWYCSSYQALPYLSSFISNSTSTSHRIRRVQEAPNGFHWILNLCTRMPSNAMIYSLLYASEGEICKALDLFFNTFVDLVFKNAFVSTTSSRVEKNTKMLAMLSQTSHILSMVYQWRNTSSHIPSQLSYFIHGVSMFLSFLSIQPEWFSVAHLNDLKGWPKPNLAKHQGISSLWKSNAPIYPENFVVNKVQRSRTKNEIEKRNKAVDYLRHQHSVDWRWKQRWRSFPDASF